jgi:hypothetical protein
MTNSFDEIRLILQKHGEDTKQKYVYHYTTGVGLKSIIENKQLWLSERSYMNDVLEVNYTKGVIKEVLSTKLNYSDQIIEKTFFENEMQYVFSTSLEKDSINMWSYYSGSDAYCIEFDRRELRDYFLEFVEEEMNFFYGPVIYNKNKQKRILTEVCEEVVDKLVLVAKDLLAETNDTTNASRYESAKYVYHFFYSLCKQQGHSCEKEFRYLISNASQSDFVIKKGLFIPILKIGSSDIKIPISRIIIGPNNHEVIAEESLRLFLDAKKYNGVKILHSNLQIR